MAEAGADSPAQPPDPVSRLAQSSGAGRFGGEGAATMEYVRKIWDARYFWTHLAMSDLRTRWRRSFLGALWSLLQPLMMTALLTVVFSRIFHTEVGRYAPYIFSGMITWEFVGGTVSGGSLAFVQADAYIKQTRHPLAIYTLRTALTNIFVFAFASIGLVVWVLLVMPETFGWPWLAALLIFPVLLLTGWSVATFLAYFATRFRDVPHALGLVLQAVWFISPVYFEADVFRKSGLGVLVDDNPIYHLLQVVRAPLLAGEWPTPANFAFALAIPAVFGLLAWWAGRVMERRVIFYL